MMGGGPGAGMGGPYGGAGAGAGAGMGGAPADTRPPREKYATQLQQIKEMGFNDEDAIL